MSYLTGGQGGVNTGRRTFQDEPADGEEAFQEGEKKKKKGGNLFD